MKPVIHGRDHISGHSRLSGADAVPVLHTLNLVVDGHGTELTTGIKGDAIVDFYCTIVSWSLVADAAGDIALDLWRSSFTGYPPTGTDSIVASSPPTLTGTDKNGDDVLAGWDLDLDAGDIIRLNVDSVTDLTRIVLALKLKTP